MLAADLETFQSLQLLDREIRAQKRPLIIWIGAGVSTWAGYPMWNDLAAQMHSIFSREESAYNKKEASEILAAGKLPELFQIMHGSNSPRYYSLLAETFSPKSVSPIFERFVKTLKQLSPHRVLTTNIDESLERHIPDTDLLQRSDFERAIGLLHNPTSFVCKLHGSISSAMSTVFSTHDYEALTSDTAYLKFLQDVFANSTMVFLGYSVRDDYVIRALLAATEERKLFGAGEHFVVCPEGADLPSKRLRPIRYAVDANSDHRSCLLVLDTILAAERSARETKNLPEPVANTPKTDSIYFLADLMPPGTWQTSQTVRFAGSSGVEHEMITGCGYVQGEIELTGYSAMHDIVVGMLCFDKIAFTLDSVAKIHALVGAETFWRLVDEDVFRPVHEVESTVLVYETPGAVNGGALASVAPGGPASTLEGYAPMSVKDRIRRSLVAAPGKEQEAEQLFERLEACVTVIPRSTVADTVRGALAHPSLRRMLGVSGGTSASAIPRWVAFPVLRLANVISTGEYCQQLGAAATRLLWGSERLASAAFSAASAQEWADDAASYVLTGRFNMDIGAVVVQSPELLTRILTFRNSQAGESFRREVSDRLAKNDGGELVAAINLGLRQSLPLSTLERARDQLSGLFVPSEPLARMTPAVWGDLRNGDARIANWRRHSKRLLDEACARLHVGPYDQCPCGSGEKLKFCCQEALRS